MVDEGVEATLARARCAEPGFGLARQQRVIWRVQHGLLPKRGTRRLFVALAAVACLAALALFAGAFGRFGGNEAAVGERWQLRDGSRILLETAETRVTKQRDSDTEVLFELQRGAARFDVTHRPERAFRVQAGPTLVEVIGTAFRVERRGAQTLVAVERGHVRVSWAGARRELWAGQGGVFPLHEVVASPPTVATEAMPSASALPLAVPAASVTSPTPPSAEALFALADRARRDGRSVEAARALRQLTQQFPRDARAPFAAFTMGRILLQNLHQPTEAARAFASARALAGGGSALAEDALAREVEAWRAAGDLRQAAARAQSYEALYPSGAHLKQVQRAGALPSRP